MLGTTVDRFRRRPTTRCWSAPRAGTAGGAHRCGADRRRRRLVADSGARIGGARDRDADRPHRLARDDPGRRRAGRSSPTDAVGLWLGPNAHLVHYPVAGGRTINVVAIVEEDWKGAAGASPATPTELAAHFSDWGNAARALVGAPSEWRKWAILVGRPRRPLGRGPRGLLGDAAHAMPPFLAQGAAMAIEDAAVLAASFAANPDDPAAALSAYEAARKPRVVAGPQGGIRNRDALSLWRNARDHAKCGAVARRPQPGAQKKRLDLWVEARIHE